MGFKLELPKGLWLPDGDPGLDGFIRRLADHKEAAIDTETTGLSLWKDVPKFWSVAWREGEEVVRACLPVSVLPLFQHIFADSTRTWILQNAKFDMHMLGNVGITLAGTIIDVRVMHALLYDEQDHDLKSMCGAHLGFTWQGFMEAFPPQNIKDPITGERRRENPGEILDRMAATNLRKLVEYAGNDAYGTLLLKEKLQKELEAATTWSAWPDWIATLWDVFIKTEAPFTKVLFTCERRGVRIDVDYLQSRRTTVVQQIADYDKRIAKEAGVFLNPDSNKQLVQFFFGSGRHKPKKMTKTGNPGCDADVLEALADAGDPVAHLLMERRVPKKILGTYIDGMQEWMDPNDRIHTHYNQDVARCMPAGELVLTNRGYLPVEQVVVGDLVIAHTGKPRRVIELSKHSPRFIYKVGLSNGLSLRTTGNHEYRSEDGWTRADKLKIGQVITVHSGKEELRTWRPEYFNAEAKFFCSTVLDIDIEEPEKVYGLTVEIDHSHVTGGIVTHNTGRLSSSKPNLQNLPRLETDDAKIRNGFIAGKGKRLLVCDYEALEMRLLAAGSGEQEMINIFLTNRDIHMGNASLMYGLPYEDLVRAKKTPKDQLDDYLKRCLAARADAKAIGFGLNYGMKAGKLARQLGCSIEEAEDKMKRYLEMYPAVSQYYAQSIEVTQETGYAFDILGRRRFLPGIVSRNKMDRWQAERQACNMGPQGSAAALVKLAMIGIYQAKMDEHYGIELILQVHDELVAEVPGDDSELDPQAVKDFKGYMEHAFPTELAVPLTVSCGIGHSLGEAK